MNPIPKDKVMEVVRKKGRTDFSGIASAMIESGYTHPARPALPEGEKRSPFIYDLEDAVATLVADGKITKEMEGGKNFYACA